MRDRCDDLISSLDVFPHQTVGSIMCGRSEVTSAKVQMLTIHSSFISFSASFNNLETRRVFAEFDWEIYVKRSPQLSIPLTLRRKPRRAGSSSDEVQCSTSTFCDGSYSYCIQLFETRPTPSNDSIIRAHEANPPPPSTRESYVRTSRNESTARHNFSLLTHTLALVAAEETKRDEFEIIVTRYPTSNHACTKQASRNLKIRG